MITSDALLGHFNWLVFVFLLVATRDLLKIADIENLLKRMVPVWLHTYSGDQRPKDDP